MRVKAGPGLRGGRERRLFARMLRDEVRRLEPLVQEAERDVVAVAGRLRAQHAGHHGFSPSCPVCGRGMFAVQENVSAGVWRWTWHCRSACFGRVPYEPPSVTVPDLDG
jgi:hypothetical protein